MRNEQSLKSDIKKIYDHAKEKINKSEDPTEGMIDDLTKAIVNYIDSAEIPISSFIVPQGIAVATAGSPVAQVGTTTSPGIVTGPTKLL